MAFTRTYQLNEFNENTGTLYINLFTYPVGESRQITADIRVPVVLPVDETGNVPTGSALTEFLDRHVIAIAPDSFLQSKLNLSLFNNQVVNANDIYALTNIVENNEIDPISVPADKAWIPVLIIPDRSYTPQGSIFTRSIIAPVGGNLGSPNLGEQFVGDPSEKMGKSPYMLFDTGVNNSKLHLIHHSKSNGITQESVITSNIYQTDSPNYIVQTYPFVFNQVGLSDLLAQGAVIEDYLRYFYVYHDPITIPDSPGRAWLEYGT